MSSDRPEGSGPRGLPVSRRRLLLSGLAAAAGSAVAPWSWLTPASAGPPPGEDERDRAYQAAFRAVLAQDPDVRYHDERGKEYLFRPRQLLVAPEDVKRVLERLRESGFEVRVGEGFGGVDRLVFDREVDIPEIVAKLRDPETWPGEKVPRVQPHHVTVGFDNLMGNPGSPPRAVRGPIPLPDPARLHDGAGITIGICDTGIWRHAGARHPVWLAGHYVPEADDEDALYSSGVILETQAGHGTYVAGVLRQSAPGVDFDPETALNPAGVGSEEDLVHALERLGRVPIVNLSLGCYTSDDLPPMPIANAIAGLGQDVVVVAAAGNAGVDRKTWPAALDGVVAVAAVTPKGGTYVPAGYSNFGPWVSACAPGEQISTYVHGKLLLPGLPPEVFAGFARWTGTSFAAPRVAGRLATMMTTNPGMSAVQAKQDLLAGASIPGYGVLVA